MSVDFISSDLNTLDLKKFMREALLEAETAGQTGEIPIGAVLVIDGEIVSRGQARHKGTKSQIRHAELNALLNGGEKLWTDYQRAVLFTTLEPCPMCLGAAVMADIPHIIFAKHDQVVLSKLSVETHPYIKRHIKSYFGGVLEEEATRILAQYKPQDLKYIETGVQ